MTGRADPGRAMHVEPDVAFGGVPRFSGVDAHPVEHRGPVRPWVRSECELGIDRRLDGLTRAREDEIESIAGRTALECVMARECVADQPIVVGQHLRVPVAERLE